jgi:membrane-associated phospholipid phosphatase
MSNLDTVYPAAVKESGAQWLDKLFGWSPWSQRRLAIVGALWALAFVIVAGTSLYLHAHPTARLPGDVGLSVLIQRIQQPLIVRFINLASDANWPTPAGVAIFLVILVLAIFRRWRAALVALIAVFLAALATFSINSWVQRPRPHDVHIHAVANIGIGSYPSGHVVNVTAFYGFLLYLTVLETRAHPHWTPWLRVIQVICGYFLLFIGLSRLLEAEHWPSDVVVGYLLGGMALIAAIVLYEGLGVYWKRRHERRGKDVSHDASQSAEQVAMDTSASATQVAQATSHTARRAADSEPVKLLARFGFGAKGIVYLIIGGLALATALGVGGALTDQNGATHVIYQQPFGAFLLIVSAIGWLGYALWCSIEAALDTENKGTDAKGVVTRVGYGAVGVIYTGLALVALGLATGKGNGGQSSNSEAQDWTARLLGYPGGVALVVLVGLVVLGIAGVLFYRAYSADFRQQLQFGKTPAEAGKGIVILGRVGYSALGIVFTIIGIFFIVAALQHNPSQARGLSGALGALLQEPFGHLLLALVALGLVAYGVYSLAQARVRRVDAT